MSDVLELYSKAPKSKDLIKAFNTSTFKNMKVDDPKSAIISPYGVTGHQSLRQKPTILPYRTLRNMADVPAIAAIINTRLNQVARFSRRPRFEGDMGFKIVLKDSERAMSSSDKKRAFEIEEFFLKTGFVGNVRRKDNMDTFVRKIVRDTLTLDVMTWENVPNLKGELAEIWAVDGATIELVATNPIGESIPLPVYAPITKRGKTDAGDIAYVQRIDGRIIAEYTEEELCYAIRNPRTDVYVTDFGLPELETLIEIVTGIVNGVRYNTSYFSENHLPQGVLEIIGKYKDEHLEGFKKHWKTMTSGAGGKWAVPVMALQEGQGFKFTPFKTSNRDMEFNEFLEFLFNIGCAVYQIDPNEVGFKSWTSNRDGMRSDNTQAKMDSSKDKGFMPLMQFLSNTFNYEIIDFIDPNFAFTWIGLDEEDEAQKLNRDKENIAMGKVTIAELRKKDDMPEILGEDGKPAKWTLAPANPQLIQVFMAEMNVGMQEQGQEQTQAEDQGQEQTQAEDQGQEQTQAEDQGQEQEHERKKEILQVEHELTMEEKKADYKHQLAVEDIKSKGRETKDVEEKESKSKLRKSIENGLEISIEWSDY